VRSPIITKPVSGPISNGSSPLKRGRFGGSGIARGSSPRTAAAICAVCSGVVPQQPPTMLRKPSFANSPSSVLVSDGCSS